MICIKQIPPLNKKELRDLLNDNTFLRKTSRGDNEIHSFCANDSLKLLYEVCRLREITFQESGGGTGKDLDVDEYDVHSQHPYNQLVVFNPNDKEIIGAYRYMVGAKDFPLNFDASPAFATSKLFTSSEKFKSDYLPKTIELGRSFIQPKYQSGRDGLFSLMNLWDGLGSLILQNPRHDYFIGKVTFYDDYNKDALELILSYFDMCCKPEKDLFKLREEKEYIRLPKEDNRLLFAGLSREEGYNVLRSELKNIDQAIPPLVNTYMNTSSNLQVFGTARNEGFGNVLETGIMIPIKDIYKKKFDTHVLYDQK